MRALFIAIFLFINGGLLVSAQYRQPDPAISAIVEAPAAPLVSISPTRNAVLLTDYNPNPGIATLAQPFLRLAGLRIQPELNSRRRLTDYTAVTIRKLSEKDDVNIQLPGDRQLSGVPTWSNDGKYIAFGMDSEIGVELWVAETATGEARRISDLYINDVLMSGFSWMKDNRHLLVSMIPPGRGKAPVANRIPASPVIDETSGKVSRVMTYQDLLENKHDEDLFEYYATSHLAIVNTQTGEVKPFGTPGMYTDCNWSPDENYALVSFVTRPFSYNVPFGLFTRKTEIRNAAGQTVREVASNPISDEIPTHGVVTGPRSFQWQPLHKARLLWVEALDGGDPKQNADYRDRMLKLEPPFTEDPVEVLKLQHRYSGINWTEARDIALISEFDRDRRWRTTYFLDMINPHDRTVLFDLSSNDAYNNPGNPVYKRMFNGESVVALDGEWAWFNAQGDSPEGRYPRLDKIHLQTGEKKTVWTSPPSTYSQFVAFTGKDYATGIIRRESKTEVPNYYLIDFGTGKETPLTQFADPAPELTGIEKKLVRYKRADGVPLSGTLLLPPGYNGKEKLPLFIWAYPREFSDMSTAGQVRGSEHTFTYLRGADPRFFVLEGYAVLMDATMPVVGDPETMNNTFVEQIVSSGRAAIDYLDSLGIIDRTRVGVGGHSYGAFMTANLLAHSDDYAFGIARSGAYNRSLTPFGFQSERRSFWEAPDVYMDVSPFAHADKIKAPILLIHGEVDNNTGTYPIQSERMFDAIKGNGGTARLVMLPHESHGYQAKESILHTLAEMIDWAKKHVNSKAQRS